MPPYQGGGDMIESVTFEKTTYNVLPLNLKQGHPMIAEVMGLGAAIDYIQSIGMEAIQSWEHELLTLCHCSNGANSWIENYWPGSEERSID